MAYSRTACLRCLTVTNPSGHQWPRFVTPATHWREPTLRMGAVKLQYEGGAPPPPYCSWYSSCTALTRHLSDRTACRQHPYTGHILRLTCTYTASATAPQQHPYCMLLGLVDCTRIAVIQPAYCSTLRGRTASSRCSYSTHTIPHAYYRTCLLLHLQ